MLTFSDKKVGTFSGKKSRQVYEMDIEYKIKERR